MNVTQGEKGSRHAHRQVDSGAHGDVQQVHIASMVAGLSGTDLARGRRCSDYSYHWTGREPDPIAEIDPAVLHQDDPPSGCLDLPREDSVTGQEAGERLVGQVDLQYVHHQSV